MSGSESVFDLQVLQRRSMDRWMAQGDSGREASLVDATAEALRAEMKKGEKRDRQRECELKDRLVRLILPAVKEVADRFYKKYRQKLEKRAGVDYEDVLTEAVAITLDIQNWESWSKEAARAQGKDAANFITYFVFAPQRKNGLESRLYDHFIHPLKAKMRTADVISLDSDVLGTDDAKHIDRLTSPGKDNLDYLVSKEGAREFLERRGVVAKIGQVLSDSTRPIFALQLILFYGLGDSRAMEDWVARFGWSIKNYENRKAMGIKLDTFDEKVMKGAYDFLLAWETGKGSPEVLQVINRVKAGSTFEQQEIAGILGGISREAVSARLKKFVKSFKEQDEKFADAQEGQHTQLN